MTPRSYSFQVILGESDFKRAQFRWTELQAQGGPRSGAWKAADLQLRLQVPLGRTPSARSPRTPAPTER